MLEPIAGALAILAGAVFLACALIAAAGLASRPQQADAMLILGNKVERSGRPSTRLQARLDKGLALYQAGYAPLVVVSGGTGVEGFDEAAVMKSYLVARGLPDEIVIQDSQGYDTYQSARTVARLARQHNWQSVLVVSQYFHLPRAALAVRRFGVAAVYAAHADFYSLRDGYSLLRELAAFPTYILRPYD